MKLELSPETLKRSCYVLSETIIPSKETLPLDVDTSENSISTTVIGIVVPVAIVIIIIIITVVMVSVGVAKTRKHHRQHIARPAPNHGLQIQNGGQRGYVAPPITQQAILGNF